MMEKLTKFTQNKTFRKRMKYFLYFVLNFNEASMRSRPIISSNLLGNVSKSAAGDNLIRSSDILQLSQDTKTLKVWMENSKELRHVQTTIYELKAFLIEHEEWKASN